MRQFAGLLFVLALALACALAQSPAQDAPSGEPAKPKIRQLNPEPPPEEEKDEKKPEKEPETAPPPKKAEAVKETPAKDPPAKTAPPKDAPAKPAPAKEKEPAKDVAPPKDAPPKDPPAKAKVDDDKADKVPDEPKKIPGIDALTAKPFEVPLQYDKHIPDGVADLKAMQDQVNMAWKKVMPAIIGVQMGNKAGSAVLVKGGYALTAGHVAISPGTGATLIFPDGKRVKGKSLGINRNVDGGLMKIVEEGDYPFVEMGNAADLKVGQWVICSGHPGGFRDGRLPPVRVGRILNITASTIYTDCYLIGGDSGGPLFDLQGRVIGINSRIGQGINQNMHVNIDTFRTGWEKLVTGQSGDKAVTAPKVILGVTAEMFDKQCKITLVRPGSPADKGGLKVDDVVLKFEGKDVNNVDDFIGQVRKRNPGDEVVVDVMRGEEPLTLKIVLGKG